MNEHLHKKLDKLIKQRSLLKRQIKNRHRYSAGDLRLERRITLGQVKNWSPLDEKLRDIDEEIRCLEKHLNEDM